MKKSTMLATAAFAVLLGLFVPCTSHATEIKDTDPTTVQWDKATVEEKTDADNDKYLLYTLPNTNYDSYDDAITGLAKYMVDATADRKYNSVSVLFPFTVVTDKTIDEAVDMSVDIDDKIDSWIRFGGNMTKREILSFSGSDWKKHENLSSFNTNIINWKKTDNGYSGLAVCAVEYSTRYDFTEYETKCLNAIKEMNVDGKSDYDKALALNKWVHAQINDTSVSTAEGQSGMKGIMERKGVCNAFATLSCYLGRCLGLDILYESGDTWDDGHAWNLIKIGDEWYYTDTSCPVDVLSNFLQGKSWLKCNIETLDSQFKNYDKIYNIPAIGYDEKYSTCEHNWSLYSGTDSSFNCNFPTTNNYFCTKCHAGKWEYYKDPKGHTPGKVIRVDREANCYTEGLQVRECTVCGKGYWETIPMTQHHWVDGKCTICGDECTHTYGEKTIITPATCTTYGSYTKTCTTCGYVYKGQIPKTQHNYEWKVTTPATCNSTGVETKTCTNCGKTNGQRQIPATGEHNWETVETIPATCTSKEKQKQECTVCHTTRTTINENSHYTDHTWAEGDGTVTCTKCGWEHTHRWVEDTSKTVPATCTSEGSKTYYCIADYKDYDQEVHKCHSTKTEILAKTAHHWVNGVCTECGATHEHDWQEQTSLAKSPTCIKKGSKTYKCSKCGETNVEEIPATGHTWKIHQIATNKSECKCSVCGATKAHDLKVVSKDPATCTKKGIIHYVCKDCGKKVRDNDPDAPALGHDWKNQNGTCSRCNAQHTHDWGEWKTTTPADCTTEGEEVRQCNTCRFEETRTLAKTDHDWGEWNITTEPSCTHEGEETRQCQNCQKTETKKLEKTAHVTEVVGAKAPSCTSEGYTGNEVCKDCHAVVKKGHKLDKTAHQWSTWKTTTPASCTHEGEETRQCSVCQETETRKLKKTDHDWSEWKTTTKPSCTHEGEETRQCKNCQETESRTLAKTAHNTEIVGAKAPSCTTEGYTGDEVCKDCHATIKKGHKLDKTAHQWSTWKTTTNPSYASEGEQTRQCSQCHQTETRKLNKLPLPKAGTKYTVGGNQYTVLKAGLSVRFSKANPKAKTVTIPNAITVDGISYKVAEVGANAFKNNKKVKKVTIGANVVKVANKAFNKCPSLRNVIIKTTLLTKKTASKKCFSKVHKKMIIKVPKKVKKSYAKIFKGFKVK